MCTFCNCRLAPWRAVIKNAAPLILDMSVDDNIMRAFGKALLMSTNWLLVADSPKNPPASFKGVSAFCCESGHNQTDEVLVSDNSTYPKGTINAMKQWSSTSTSSIRRTNLSVHDRGPKLSSPSPISYPIAKNIMIKHNTLLLLLLKWSNRVNNIVVGRIIEITFAAVIACKEIYMCHENCRLSLVPHPMTIDKDGL